MINKITVRSQSGNSYYPNDGKRYESSFDKRFPAASEDLLKEAKWCTEVAGICDDITALDLSADTIEEQFLKIVKILENYECMNHYHKDYGKTKRSISIPGLTIWIEI